MSKINITNALQLHPLESLLGSEKESKETIQELPIEELHPFKGHPFRVVNDENMEVLTESIQKSGVTQPIIVRPRLEGGYEIITGHRRKLASELAGKTTIPAIIREYDDDTAITEMVDSNIQRETLLPSEKAFAYKMKLEAMKRKVGRPSKNDSQVGNNIHPEKSVDILSEEIGVSKNQIFRYIRLTELIKPLLEMADNNKLSFNVAVELSYLDKHFQELILENIEREQKSPSLLQAKKLKVAFQENQLTTKVLLEILGTKKEETRKITIKETDLKKYFPRDYTPKQIQDTIIGLLEQWQNGQKK